MPSRPKRASRARKSTRTPRPSWKWWRRRRKALEKDARAQSGRGTGRAIVGGGLCRRRLSVWQKVARRFGRATEMGLRGKEGSCQKRRCNACHERYSTTLYDRPSFAKPRLLGFLLYPTPVANSQQTSPSGTPLTHTSDPPASPATPALTAHPRARHLRASLPPAQSPHLPPPLRPIRP